MFDPAVIGTVHIGMRNVAVEDDGAWSPRNGRRPRRRPIRQWIAGRMRATADWIDPVLLRAPVGAPGTS
jgi:hypothetical protein